MDQPLSDQIVNDSCPLLRPIPRLPTECLLHILSFISEDDIETLHSAILVNWQWCYNIAPILWKKPFAVKATNPSLSKFSKIIPIYLNSLNADLVSVEFKERFFPFFDNEIKKPFFNYPSFLRELDFKKLYDAISESSAEIFLTNSRLEIEFELIRSSFAEVREPEKHEVMAVENIEVTNDTVPAESEVDYEECDGHESQYDDDSNQFEIGSEQEYGEIENHEEIPFVTTSEGRKLLIAKEISQMFMRECQVFDKLTIDIRGFPRIFSFQLLDYISLPCFPGASNCLQKITDLACGGEFFKDEIFNALALCCHELYSISIVDTFYSATNALANLISVQRNLRRFSWVGGYGDLTPVVLTLSSQFNNLKEVHLEKGFFRDASALGGLSDCKNLEALSIAECHLTSSHVRPLVDANFQQLKSLEITNNHYPYDEMDEEEFDPPSEELSTIIRNANRQLLVIRLNLELYIYPGIIETIGLYCPNLKTLSVNIKTDEQALELITLLRSCRELESLIICGYSWNTFSPADHILPEIGMILPETLTHLDLTKWVFEVEELKQFLKNCKATLKYMEWHCFAYHEEHKLTILDYAQSRGIEVENFQMKMHDTGYGWKRYIGHISVKFGERNTC
ncbi:11800_t:CDS:1 [Acaulospora morrowiae]|uniref:11800_t:CDS:1 n=1 Tax=Acaulospora morrowiae TaxID=94023 RepID=A0A9N9FGK7_9GLOM|nr:11800_t:CDS:1 [Acaulospora morrowiae]